MLKKQYSIANLIKVVKAQGSLRNTYGRNYLIMIKNIAVIKHQGKNGLAHTEKFICAQNNLLVFDSLYTSCTTKL